MKAVVLEGLDGLNPLAFLAALGVLRILDDGARTEGGRRPTLTWEMNDTWNPLLTTSLNLDGIIREVMLDRDRWSNEPALLFAYTGKGERSEPTEGEAVRDIKPPPELMREFLNDVAEGAAQGQHRSARHAAAFASDVAVDNKGNTKPTALHFTAGNQSFLGSAAEVHAGLTEEDVREALVGPWTRSSKLKSLGWDPLGAFSARMYALRATDPGPEKRPSVPGAEWLAFVGMSFFPTAPRGRKLYTTGVSGEWKASCLRWPIWTVHAESRTVESLLRSPELLEEPADWRTVRGVQLVCSAPILRSDVGGYGSFGPTSVT